MLLRAIIDIISPDIIYGTVNSSGEAPWSKPEQLHNKNFELNSAYTTLEPNRWLLDGNFRVIPDDPQQLSGEIGDVGDVLSGNDGTFSPAVYVEQPFSNVSILQACSIYFPNDDFDGIPVNFTVEIFQGGTAYFTKTITGNTETKVSFDGFTIQNPDAIRITITRWSLPGRRVRIPEIIPGLYEEWDADIIASFDVIQQGNVACLSLPYGTCTLRMDNLDRRFEPRNKNGLFQSIEERQGIDVSIGVETSGGTDWKHVGVYYQYSGGWTTGDNGLTMEWKLADIIGLLQSREFIVPDTLPTTLNGWLAALVGQLGENFKDRYHADPNYGNLAVTATGADAVTGKKCGDILLWACQATGTWPRSDAETGYLTAEPLWSQGNKLDLDNMTAYPTIKSNDSIGALIFNLSDGTQYVITGNSASASETKTIDNPFLHTKEAALTAARLILSAYGGNQLETTGRGDPSSEIGDVDTVWLDESNATTGRRVYQTFNISNGVLQGCQSRLLQADGSFMFQECVVITADGTYTAPAGASQLRVVLVGGGDGSENGADGTWDSAGADGADGKGANVWYGTIDINEQQTFSAIIGQGGGIGEKGGVTTFGAYSSANGDKYDLGYTDIANGNSYARPAVSVPLNGTGDGAVGGKGGNQGVTHSETTYSKDKDGNLKPSGTRTVVDVYPGKGTPGRAGAAGCVVVFWDKA
jgi:hypothetical protein